MLYNGKTEILTFNGILRRQSGYNVLKNTFSL